MKTAIITGASTGLGLEFVRQLCDNYPEIESLWVVARRRERLEAAVSGLADRLDINILPLDLCSEDSFAALEEMLRDRKPDVRLLVNNAGCGYLGNLGELETDKQTRMVDLNIRALTAVTNIVIPYMSRGARVINVSSIASFCPNPRMTVYSAGKAYVSAFSRGINEELKPKGVGVTVVCPGPMDTEFISLGGIKGNSKTFDVLPYCDPKKVAAGTYAAAKRGKFNYTPKAFYKFFRIIAKILPHNLVIRMTKT